MSLASTPAATPAETAPAAHWPLLAATLLAATVPTLAAFNQPPSATLLNQCLAVALWGGVAVLLPPGRWVRGLGPLLAALAVVAAGALWSCVWGGLPLSLGLLALGLLAAAALMVLTGANAALSVTQPGALSASAAPRPSAAQVFAARTNDKHPRTLAPSLVSLLRRVSSAIRLTYASTA